MSPERAPGQDITHHQVPWPRLLPLHRLQDLFSGVARFEECSITRNISCYLRAPPPFPKDSASYSPQLPCSREVRKCTGTCELTWIHMATASSVAVMPSDYSVPWHLKNPGRRSGRQRSPTGSPNPYFGLSLSGLERFRVPESVGERELTSPERCRRTPGLLPRSVACEWMPRFISLYAEILCSRARSLSPRLSPSFLPRSVFLV